MLNRYLFLASLGVVCLAVDATAATASAFQDEQAKSIQSREYLRKRPVAADAGGTVGADVPPKPAVASFVRVKIQRRKPPVKVERPLAGNPPAETARLGFTVWRVRDVPQSEKSKGLAERDERTGNVRMAERADSNSPLAVGDSVRIGIESLTHAGYLYIIDREKYSDGGYGPPTLIYPTLRYRNGDNYVRPGDITFLPGPGREITVTADYGKKQVAEELIVIVSPTRLIPQSDLRMDQIKITPNQVLQWVKRWSTEDIQIDQVDTQGQAMTEAERTAGAEQAKGLTERPILSQNDPLPQTIFEMKVKPGNPLITTITLPIKQR